MRQWPKNRRKRKRCCAIPTPALPLLDVHDLTVEFATRRGIVRAVQHVNITVAKGETLGIVGESGSGKSVTSYAVMRILDRAGRIAEGSVMFSGVDLRATPRKRDARPARPRNVDDLPEPARRAQSDPQGRPARSRTCCCSTRRSTAPQVSEKAIEMLEQVRIARPRERYHAYPFELSGGMCQRVVIALALACQPQLLIADEPTTGLDVTTQKAVMDLVVELTRERGMSTILITHDLGLAAAYCDRVVVMEKGHVVETATSRRIFKAPAHPYTRKLMRATPRPGVSLRDLLPEEEAKLRQAHRQQQPARATLTRRRRSWWSKSWSRNIRATAPARSLREAVRPQAAGASRRRSAPSTASASPSRAAKASAWSANPAAANPPPR